MNAGEREAHVRALEERLGPFRDPLVRAYAEAVAAHWGSWWESDRAVNDAQHRRQHGRGRRPSLQQINRLGRRRGLDWATYDAALRRLEALAAGNGHSRPTSGAELLALRRGQPA